MKLLPSPSSGSSEKLYLSTGSGGPGTAGSGGNSVFRLSVKSILLVIIAMYGMIAYLFVAYPSPERILFVQTVTGTRYSPISAFAAEDPFLFDNLSPVVRSILTTDELAALQAACATAQTSHVEQALKQDSTQVLQENHTVQSIPLLAVKRYSAKLHLICPLYLVFDYPMCYAVASKLGLAELPFLTANLISLIHPVCGLIAGILFARAVKERTGTLFGPSDSPTNDQPASGGSVDGGSGSGGFGVVGGATQWGESSGAEMPIGSSAASTACTKISRTMSSTAFLTSVDILSPAQTQQQQQQQQPSSTTAASSNGGQTMLEMSTNEASAVGGGQGPLAVATPMLTFDSDEARKEKEGHVALCATTVDVRLVHAGCVFFFLRNWLDALDGVVARVQRANTGITSPIPTAFGVNGHSLDVVADGLGVFLASVGILLFLFRRQVMLSRLLFSLLTTRFGISFRWMTARGISVGRAVALAGLLVPAVAGGVWEVYMLRYSNLFDLHSNQREDIFQLERQLHVRINMALWSVTCADTILYVYVVAMLWDRIWPVLQFYAGVGYLWLGLVVLHSHYVWTSVIGAHPGARQLLAQVD